MQLGVVFWFYRDPVLCLNRLRSLQKLNPHVPLYGLYGGDVGEASAFSRRLAPLLDDFWAYPGDADPAWKWRNGDLMLARWHSERGHGLEWDSIFVAQWDLVVTVPLRRLLPDLDEGDMLLSGLRAVRDVEQWWQWTNGIERRAEYHALLEHVTARFGAVRDPMCCQFISMVLPRQFLDPYVGIDRPELGFLEYKVPIYAQAFGVPLVPDTCFRPWWPEDPATSGAKRTECLMHAWASSVRLPVMLYEAYRPGGRRAFHPYRGIYPHDLASVPDLLAQWRRSRLRSAVV